MNRACVALCIGVSVGAFNQAVFAHGDEHQEGKTGQQVTLVGELIDTACFVSSDGDAKGLDHAECATSCLGSGIPAGILPGNSKDMHGLKFLLTNPVVLAPYAAKTIKVEGTLHSDFYAVEVEKLFVKQDGGWTEIALKDEHHNKDKKESHKGHKDDHSHGH